MLPDLATETVGIDIDGERSGRAMENECVVGVFAGMKLANGAVHALDEAGFLPDHVSIVTRHIDPKSDVGRELSYGDDSMRDAAIGATLGGLVGIVSDAAIVAVAGMGFIVVAGPFIVATTAIVGAYLGAMEGWGVHDSHIRKYEKLVQDGKVLVVVDGDPREVCEAEQILRGTPAAEVHLHTKTSDDAPEIDDVC